MENAGIATVPSINNGAFRPLLIAVFWIFLLPDVPFCCNPFSDCKPLPNNVHCGRQFKRHSPTDTTSSVPTSTRPDAIFFFQTVWMVRHRVKAHHTRQRDSQGPGAHELPQFHLDKTAQTDGYPRPLPQFLLR
jgi:hypothetical protein